MSQQKDSNQDAELGEPAAEPVAESTPDPAPVLAKPAPAPDAEAAPEAEPKAGSRTEPEDSEPPAGTRSLDTHRVVTLASIALLAVAAVAAAWFGGTWIVGGLMQDRPRAQARDNALDAAQQAAINITSMNLADVDGSLSLARSSMTGELLDASTANQDQIKKQVLESNVNMTSKVVGGSLTELNSERDRAAALVVLEVTENGPGKPAAKLRYTWSVDVVLDDGVWKADQVQVVSDPVSLGGGAQQPAPGETTPTTEPAPPGN
ncbi:hypothetical protein ACWDOP_09620 [Nocardia sp. NPDC003693]